MNIIDLIRNRILKFLRLDKLAQDPTSEQLTFINDTNDINKQDMDEARVWYIGDSNELLNYYTVKQNYGNMEEPVYNRNRANYFWGISSNETNIKRVHSGLPKAIIETLTNAVGFPIITTSFQGKKLDTAEIIRKAGLRKKTMQEQIPMTMAIGWGAWKIDVDQRISKFPIVQFYEARNVEFIAKKDTIIGLIFKDYYQYKGKKYVLLETRRLNENGNSCVEYELFELKSNGDATPCEMGEIPELANLKDVEIPNYKHILGVPCRFFHNPNNPTYGKSIYYGKYDLFDDLDQSLSQRSQTCRVSTPVEYYPVDVLKRSKDGEAILPSVYNRQYVKKEGIADGDGNMDNNIQTTQPTLNFEQYSQEQLSLVSMIMEGVLSPATMGLDLARNSNALAQREKEKVTIMTRNNIIDSETDILKELVSILWAMKSYIDTGNVPVGDFEVSVKFNEFASPTFESLSQTLLPLWQAGAISDEFFVEKLYGDSLSKEEKAKEIEALKKNKERDDMNLGAFGNDGMGKDMGEQSEDAFKPKASKQ